MGEKKFLGGREREWRRVGDRRNGGGWKRKGMTMAACGKEKRFCEGGEGKEITAGGRERDMERVVGQVGGNAFAGEEGKEMGGGGKEGKRNALIYIRLYA